MAMTASNPSARGGSGGVVGFEAATIHMRRGRSARRTFVVTASICTLPDLRRMDPA
jgi:hypothetical protein